MDKWEKIEGTPWPLGMTWVKSQQEYNFALYSRHAESVTLLLYAERDPANPVHQFDPQEGSYWGYMTLNFFSPHHDYASGGPCREFRQMVKAFHAAGIEVWLDVVYYHTSEAGDDGPTHSYCGIDNKSYYLTHRETGEYLNDTGCGNTLNCAHPIVRALILSSLQHWSKNMHVDGFRFDLASIFTRTLDGAVNTLDPPLFCAGDEFMNTQKGNNNPYNQDNEITWLDWELLERNRDMFRFFKSLIAFRKAHPSIARSRYWREDVQWYGTTGGVDLCWDYSVFGLFFARVRASGQRHLRDDQRILGGRGFCHTGRSGRRVAPGCGYRPGKHRRHCGDRQRSSP
jgi:pullulanase/glycogen debranching enzyme